MLIAENASIQKRFDRWVFCRGMLFNSPDKWWGDHGRRDFPHEGIDLCLYRDGDGGINRLDESTRIPAMFAGEVRAMFKDFLGKTIILEHENFGGGTGRSISFYAHTKPRAGIAVGVTVKEGDIIATLADTGNSKSNILPHLHFSCGWPTASFSYDGFVWNIIRTPAMITLLDPLPLIGWSYQELADGTSVCYEL